MSINTKEEAIMISVIVSELMNKGVDMIEELGGDRIGKLSDIINAGIPEARSGSLEKHEVINAISSYIDGTSEVINKQSKTKNSNESITMDDIVLLSVLSQAIVSYGLEQNEFMSPIEAMRVLYHIQRLDSNDSVNKSEKDILISLYREIADRL